MKISGITRPQKNDMAGYSVQQCVGSTCKSWKNMKSNTGRDAAGIMKSCLAMLKMWQDNKLASEMSADK